MGRSAFVSYWPLERKFFRVRAHRQRAPGMHHIDYDDGDQEEIIQPPSKAVLFVMTTVMEHPAESPATNDVHVMLERGASRPVRVKLVLWWFAQPGKAADILKTPPLLRCRGTKLGRPGTCCRRTRLVDGLGTREGWRARPSGDCFLRRQYRRLHRHDLLPFTEHPTLGAPSVRRARRRRRARR